MELGPCGIPILIDGCFLSIQTAFFPKRMHIFTLTQPYLLYSYLLINLQSTADSLFQRLRGTKLVQ